MRRAHFVVGFSNWGKTTVIYDIFGGQTRFRYDGRYKIAGINNLHGFMVQSQSNDDVGWDLIRRIGIRITDTTPHTPDLIAALCPTMEPHNDFRQILADNTFSVFDEFHFYLLRYKWEHHAELIVSEIKKSYGNTRPNSHFHIIDDANIPVAQRTTEKVRQIRNILTNLYP